MRCSLLISGVDKLYIEELTKYLVKSKKNQFEITIVQENINDQLSAETYDLYLFEELVLKDISEENLKGLGDKVVLLLEALTEEDIHKKHILFKYKKASIIEERLEQIFLSITTSESVVQTGMGPKVIGCYSPCGGSGNTTVAQILAQIKKGLNQKVLLLSLESFPGYHLIYHHMHSDNLSDYMLHMMTKSNWLLGLEKMISVDHKTGIHYFKPARSEQDLYDFDNKMWVEWVGYMIDYSDYDTIIIDMNAMFIGNSLELLKQCDERVYTVRGDTIGDSKWTTFVNDLKQLGYEGVLESSLLIANKLMPASDVGYGGYDIVIEYDSDLIQFDKEGVLSLNHYAKSYKIIEELMQRV